MSHQSIPYHYPFNNYDTHCSSLWINKSAFTIELTQERNTSLSFVVDVTVNTEEVISRVCAHFSQELFWSSGIYADALDTQLIETLLLKIDGNIIPDDDLQIIVTDNLNGVVEEGILLGTYGGYVSTCTEISDLEGNIHSITVELQDLSGQWHQNTYQFEIVK